MRICGMVLLYCRNIREHGDLGGVLLPVTYLAGNLLKRGVMESPTNQGTVRLNDYIVLSAVLDDRLLLTVGMEL